MDISFGDGSLAGELIANSTDSDILNGRPGLVICGGFPISTDEAELPGRAYKPLAEQIAMELGWSVLLFNYRGCGNSSGDFSMKGWLEDVCMAVEYLKSQVLEVWMVGFGMGGSLSICAAGKIPEVGGVVTAGAPVDFSEWTAAAEELLSRSKELGLISSPGYPPDSQSWIDELTALDVEVHSKDLAPRPLLVIHGTNDTMVSTLDARAIADAHGSAEIRIMEGITHRLAVDPRVLAIILGWLDRQIPGRGAQMQF